MTNPSQSKQAIHYPRQNGKGFAYTVLHHSTPKQGKEESENQDHRGLNLSQATFVVSDGVTNSLMPKDWSEALTLYWAEHPTTIEEALNDESVLDYPRQLWDAKRRAAVNRGFWLASKADAASGATLVCARLDQKKKAWIIDAMGDSCAMIWQRASDGSYTRNLSFPLSNPKHFTRSPRIFYSTHREQTKAQPFYDSTYQTAHYQKTGDYRKQLAAKEGDVLILSTDAMSEWLLVGTVEEQSQKVKTLIEVLADSDSSAFERFVQNLRDKDEIDNDDTTAFVVMLEGFDWQTFPKKTSGLPQWLQSKKPQKSRGSVADTAKQQSLLSEQESEILESVFFSTQHPKKPSWLEPPSKPKEPAKPSKKAWYEENPALFEGDKPTPLFYYIGAKNQLWPHLRDLFSEIGTDIIAEPFAGSLVVSRNYGADEIYIAEANPEVRQIWEAFKKGRYEDLFRQMIMNEVEEEYRTDLYPEEASAAKTLHSKIFADPFGRKGYPTDKLLMARLDAFKKTSEEMKKATIFSDAFELIKKLKGREDVTWFFDPPYPDACHVGYAKKGKCWDMDDHNKLMKEIDEIKGVVVITGYKNMTPPKHMGFEEIAVEVDVRIGKKGKGRKNIEYIWWRRQQA